MPQGEYRVQSRVFLDQAFEELSRNDLRQASEKGWGAASQILKAVAEARGWSHGRHNQLYDSIRRLMSEEGVAEYLELFQVAGELHTNFYEGHMDKDEVTSNLQHVARFVEKLEELLARG